MTRSNARTTLIVSCMVFFSLGWVTGVLGPVLPELAAHTGRGLADIGAVFTALFLGALCAQSVSGPIGDWVGQRPVQLVGIAVLAAGMIGVAVSRSFPLTFLCALLAGLGHGSVDVGTNVLIAEVYPRRSVSALNLLNLFFGAGAVAGPALASFTLARWSVGLPALWAVVVVLVLLLPVAYKLVGRPHRDHPTGMHADQPRTLAPSVYISPRLWVFGALLLVYVGIENGMGGWTTTYIQRTTVLRIETAALVTSGYWLALTAGRMLSTFLGIRLSSHRVLSFSLGICALAGPLLALTTGNGPWTVVAVLLLGFGFGAIFPTTLAIVTASFPQGPGKAASVVAAMGSIGGMTVPWVQGQLLDRRGPALSVLFLAAGAVAMLFLYGVARRLSRPAQ